MLNRLLRPFCRKCDAVLTGRGGENKDPLKADFAAGVLEIQRQISGIVIGGPGRLARWYDEPGWNCPYEARAAVGRLAPLQHLSVRWRALTLEILRPVHRLNGNFLDERGDFGRIHP